MTMTYTAQQLLCQILIMSLIVIVDESPLFTTVFWLVSSVLLIPTLYQIGVCDAGHEGNDAMQYMTTLEPF